MAGLENVTFNGLTFGIDRDTGNLAYLSSAATGPILIAADGPGGLLDLAYPLPAFAPMRLGSEHSQARVVPSPDGVLITWEALGPSRLPGHSPRRPGKVRAEVRIRPAGDGRSVILSCRIENHSEAAVEQELFPDFHGLIPLAGEGADGIAPAPRGRLSLCG